MKRSGICPRLRVRGHSGALFIPAPAIFTTACIVRFMHSRSGSEIIQISGAIVAGKMNASQFSKRSPRCRWPVIRRPNLDLFSFLYFRHTSTAPISCARPFILFVSISVVHISSSSFLLFDLAGHHGTHGRVHLHTARGWFRGSGGRWRDAATTTLGSDRAENSLHHSASDCCSGLGVLRWAKP